MCEAEDILNDRPISPSSDYLNDIDILTPNHILQLKVKPTMPPGLFQKEDIHSQKMEASTIHYIHVMEKVGQRIPMMQERQKWHISQRNFTVGDLVLVLEDTSPKNSWLMGRIT